MVESCSFYPIALHTVILLGWKVTYLFARTVKSACNSNPDETQSFFQPAMVRKVVFGSADTSLAPDLSDIETIFRECLYIDLLVFGPYRSVEHQVFSKGLHHKMRPSRLVLQLSLPNFVSLPAISCPSMPWGIGASLTHLELQGFHRPEHLSIRIPPFPCLTHVLLCVDDRFPQLLEHLKHALGILPPSVNTFVCMFHYTHMYLEEGNILRSPSAWKVLAEITRPMVVIGSGLADLTDNEKSAHGGTLFFAYKLYHAHMRIRMKTDVWEIVDEMVARRLVNRGR